MLAKYIFKITREEQNILAVHRLSSNVRFVENDTFKGNERRNNERIY